MNQILIHSLGTELLTITTKCTRTFLPLEGIEKMTDNLPSMQKFTKEQSKRGRTLCLCSPNNNHKSNAKTSFTLLWWFSSPNLHNRNNVQWFYVYLSTHCHVSLVESLSYEIVLCFLTIWPILLEQNLARQPLVQRRNDQSLRLKVTAQMSRAHTVQMLGLAPRSIISQSWINWTLKSKSLRIDGIEWFSNNSGQKNALSDRSDSELSNRYITGELEQWMLHFRKIIDVTTYFGAGTLQFDPNFMSCWFFPYLQEGTTTLQCFRCSVKIPQISEALFFCDGTLI